jgi:hypothetical protein
VREPLHSSLPLGADVSAHAPAGLGASWAGAEAVDDTPVAHALDRLAEVDTLPVAEHVEVYDLVHRLLQDALASLDGV